MKTYKFYGANTNGSIKYKAESTTAIGLYTELVNKDIISIINGDPYDMEAERLGRDLTDDEIIDLIGKCDGTAYHQKIWQE